MDNLEKYIQNNLDKCNSGEMPQGHRERFMAKLQARHPQPTQAKRKLPWRLAGVISAAAIAVLYFTIGTPSQEQHDTITIQELAKQMYIEETEVLQMFTEEEQYMINSVKSITEEAIPLADQLPDELTPARRAEILKEYYKAKTASLRQIKTLYAQSDQIID